MEHIESTKHPSEWLQLRLGVDKVGGALVCFNVDFVNGDKDSSHALEFSNRSAKAEFMCLSIFDRSGKAVRPQRREIPRLTDTRSDRHWIEPNNAWRFELRAELLDSGWLEFAGAAYLLERSELYSCEFEYCGVLSNRCRLEL